MIRAPSLTIGVEEEYLIVDRESRDLVTDEAAPIMAEAEAALGAQVAPEFLTAQIEVGTRPCRTVAEIRDDLRRLRSTVAEIAQRHGCAIIAASTHPFARWTAQRQTAKERYDDLAHNLGAAARRLLICGCHVHAGIEDEDLRIDLMNQAVYFLPHLLALSTSSPYWQGEDTGLASYRLTVFDALPRTGLPDRFESWAEYARLVERMKSAAGIEDASKMWWDIRPSARFPTVEMRVCDICTRLEDAVTMAAMYQSLLSMLWRLRRRNQRWRIYPQTLVMENRWRAQRGGVEGKLYDLGADALAPVPELIDEIISLCAEDAAERGCSAELDHAAEIARSGSSAMRQRAAYDAAKARGLDHPACLRAVVDHLIAETVEGL